MQRSLFGFCGGATLLALPWPGPASLPGALAAVGATFLPIAALLAVCWRPCRPALLPFLGACAGLVWSGSWHQAALNARIAADGGGAEVTLTARILDEPAVAGIGRDGLPVRRFRASVVAGTGTLRAGTQVRLSWYGAPELAKGELWRWHAVLRSPWGYANPGGFDYERWLLGARLQGTGYVRDGRRLAAASPGAIDRLRTALVERVRALPLDHGPVLLAQLVDETAGIDAALWETFRATGTVHLMVISGLQVSLAAGLGFLVGRVLVRLVPGLPLWLDARWAGCLTGSVIAALYVALADAGLPSLRALVMSGATLALLAGGRSARLGSGLLAALAVLLVLQPLAIHQQGFWLSFGAVLVLYLCLGHRQGRKGLMALLRAQIAISAAMLPLVALITASLPWTSLPANLVAVPVISLLVVPALLLGAGLLLVAPTPAGWALQAADSVIGLLLRWLEWLALVPSPPASGSTLALLLAQAAALAWLLGVPRQHRLPLLLALVLPFVPLAAGIAYGAYRVTALDVGQGAATLVDTARHRLLYDAGPGFASGFETGSAVVVPSAVATGPARLDALVLSHWDLDHVGGAAPVLEQLTPRRVFGPTAPPEALRVVLERLPGRVLQHCEEHDWRWDGVTFRLLRVERPDNASDNDRSCILLVDDGRHRTLLTGDIGRRVEGGLVRLLVAAEALPVRVLFAPHHGSRSSSSPALGRVLRPRLVLVEAGRGNRFGHPHPEVVARYRAVGAAVHQTGREGALVWHSGEPERLVRWRYDGAPYWRSDDADAAVSRR